MSMCFWASECSCPHLLSYAGFSRHGEQIIAKNIAAATQRLTKIWPLQRDLKRIHEEQYVTWWLIECSYTLLTYTYNVRSVWHSAKGNMKTLC